MMDETRIDKWLCGIRLFKSRSLSAAACEGGHVTINDKTARPSTPVRVGNIVKVRIDQIERTLQVAHLVDKRSSPQVAAACIIDHTPVIDPESVMDPIFVRDRGSGRPTKRDRRTLDRLQSQQPDL
jgi:ribosome-associated heat shock protein Hsp15